MQFLRSATDRRGSGIVLAAARSIMPRRRRYGMAGFVFHVLNRGARRGVLFETPSRLRRVRAASSVRPSTSGRSAAEFLRDAQLTFTCSCLAGDRSAAAAIHALADGHARPALAMTRQGRSARAPSIRAATRRFRSRPTSISCASHVTSSAIPCARGCVASRGLAMEQPVASRGRDGIDFPLAEWPVDPPIDWVDHVERAADARRAAAIRRCVIRGCAIGNASWQKEVAKSLGIPGYFQIGRAGRAVTTVDGSQFLLRVAGMPRNFCEIDPTPFLEE